MANKSEKAGGVLTWIGFGVLVAAAMLADVFSGGGGNNGGAGSDAPAPPPSSPVAIPKPIPPKARPSKSLLLDRHNALRQSLGASPLSWSKALEQAARKHAQWMAATNRLSHVGDGGSQFDERIGDAGYAGMAHGENIAGGYRSEEAVFRAWVRSPGHHANITAPDSTEMGAATVGKFWVVVFGGPDHNKRLTK